MSALSLTSPRWFYPDVSTAEAEALVAAAGSEAGHWLLRFSSSERGGLAFTVGEGDGRTRHYRVSRAGGGGGGGGYVVRLKGRDEAYAGLREMVAGARALLRLTRPLEGSPIALPARGALYTEYELARVAFAEEWSATWPLGTI